VQDVRDLAECKTPRARETPCREPPGGDTYEGTPSPVGNSTIHTQTRRSRHNSRSVERTFLLEYWFLTASE
jgi:hypothetical protein